MSGAMSRRKGAAGERQWAAELKGEGFEAHRGRQYSGGPGTPDVKSNAPMHWEVKRAEKLSLYKAMEQAGEDAKAKRDYSPPAVAHRRNGKEWVVAMYSWDFFQLLRDVRDGLVTIPDPPGDPSSPSDESA